MRIIIYLFMLALSSSYVNVFADNAKPTDKSTYTISVNDLLHQDGFSLHGSGGGRDIYLPVLPQWNVSKIHLHLLLTRDRSTNPASITALVKNFPVSSFSFATNATGQQAWDFDIDPRFIDTKLVTVGLRRNWSEQGSTCLNYLDPSSWIAFDGSSTITYEYTSKPYEPNLNDFPAPFITDPSLRSDQVLILLPDHFTTQELQSSYYVANVLNKRTTWRGVTLQGDTYNHADDKLKSAANVVVIGSGSDIASIIKPAMLPLNINDAGIILDSQGKRVADDLGVLMLIQSPWNTENAVLIITGNSSLGINKAANALRSPSFKNSVLYGKYAFVKDFARPSAVTIDWSDATLADFGYKDAVVYGGGDSSIKYEIELPSNLTPDDMDMQIHYSVSPLLSSRNSSFIALQVNGFPVTGIRVSAENSHKETWKFHIGKETLMPGKNTLNFMFSLKFYNMDCAPNDMTLAWGVIYADSKLKVSFSSQKKELVFGDFDSVTQDTSVFLPKDSSIFTPQEVINLILNMAVNIFNINNLNIYYDDTDIASVCRDASIIYIGNVNDNKQMMNYRYYFPFGYLNNGLVIRQKILPLLHVSNEVPNAIIQLTNSPFDPKQLFLMITAKDVKGYSEAINTFFNPRKNQYLRGDAALIYKDGTFTSINVARLEAKVENNKLISNMRYTVTIGFISFASVFFGSIIFVMIYRRAKKYFGRTPK